MAFEKGRSGNPKGRPARGKSLAEAVRRAVDMDDLIAKAKILLDSPTDSVRLAALNFLADRGWGKATQHISVERPESDLAQLTDEQLGELKARVQAQLGAPQVIDIEPTENETPKGEGT